MKVLIVTLCDYFNYGNRLQNYALEQLMKELPCDVSSGLMVTSKETDMRCSKTEWKRWMKQVMPLPLYKIFKQMKKVHQPALHRKRRAAFQAFSKQYLHMVSPIYVKKEKDVGRRFLSDYDYYIAGSDQVWHPEYGGRDYYFLTFAPPEKRIAFAASFGVEELPLDQKERYARLLRKFKYISVREKSGANIVKELTGRDADVVLDPTLLLSRGDWDKLVKQPRVLLPEHYILSFFLGEEPETAIESFAARRSLPVIHMNREEYPELYVFDPAEFLYVVKHADYVLTDSFHGTVFSIKFEREFYVFHRKQQGMENMFTRISYLLERFELEDREQERGAVCETDPVSAEQWKRIREELETEHGKTMKKMCEVMGIQGT